MVFLELLAILVPLQRGRWVAASLAAELDGLTGWDGVKLFLHFFWMSPLRCHCCRRAGNKTQVANGIKCIF